MVFCGLSHGKRQFAIAFPKSSCICKKLNTNLESKRCYISNFHTKWFCASTRQYSLFECESRASCKNDISLCMQIQNDMLLVEMQVLFAFYVNMKFDTFHRLFDKMCPIGPYFHVTERFQAAMFIQKRPPKNVFQFEEGDRYHWNWAITSFDPPSSKNTPGTSTCNVTYSKYLPTFSIEPHLVIFST